MPAPSAAACTPRLQLSLSLPDVGGGAVAADTAERREVGAARASRSGARSRRDRAPLPRQIELPRHRRPRGGPPLASFTALPVGWVVLECVMVPDPRRRAPRERPRLRRLEDAGQVGALNVAGPRLRTAGTRYAARLLHLVEATEHRAAYWRATDVVQLPEGFSL